jgi:hypothetical protein
MSGKRTAWDETGPRRCIALAADKNVRSAALAGEKDNV